MKSLIALIALIALGLVLAGCGSTAEEIADLTLDRRPILAMAASPDGGEIAVGDGALSMIGQLAGGDARQALNHLELAVSVAAADEVDTIDRALVQRVAQRAVAHYDKGREEHFNLISALHKSLRNSDVQASLYWLGRMLEGGEDPFVAAIWETRPTAVEERDGLLALLYRSLRLGGLLILSEKVRFSDPVQNARFDALHQAYKRANGYSDLEIGEKRRALERVLRPDSPERLEQRLAQAGFPAHSRWFQSLNFLSYLAWKD